MHVAFTHLRNLSDLLEYKKYIHIYDEKILVHYYILKLQFLWAEQFNNWIRINPPSQPTIYFIKLCSSNIPLDLIFLLRTLMPHSFGSETKMNIYRTNSPSELYLWNLNFFEAFILVCRDSANEI